MSRSDKAASSPAARLAGVEAEEPRQRQLTVGQVAMACSSSTTILACAGFAGAVRRRSPATLQPPVAAQCPRCPARRLDRRRAPLRVAPPVSSSPEADAENDLPDRNSRSATASVASAIGPSRSPIAPPRRWPGRWRVPATAIGVQRSCAASRNTSSRESPSAGSACATRRRISDSVPSCRSRRRRCGRAPPPIAGPAPVRRSWSGVGRCRLRQGRHKRHPFRYRGHGDGDRTGHGLIQTLAAQHAEAHRPAHHRSR